MFSRIFRKVLCSSAKLRDKGVLKNNTLIFPALTITVQKILPCVNYHCSVRHYTSDHVLLPKDPEDRKRTIDSRAQEKLDEIIKNDPESAERLKILELEHTILKQEGEQVPSKLRPRDWIELIKLNSHLKRKKFFEYLFKIEKATENRKVKQVENQKALDNIRLEREKSVQDDGTMIYGFGNNFMLRRITDSTMNHLWNWNSIKAIMYGNKVVFDCSYEKYMNSMEIKSCTKQIMESYATNRTHNFPFQIFLCNVNFRGEFIDRLNRFFPNLFDDDFPITVTSKSYLEYFEKSKLVYLSPNSTSELTEYDPDSIYIIGAYVDKGCSQPISLSKAKEDGIRHVKLPLDRFTHFGDGSNKNLTLNQVFGIMVDVQTGDWKAAMRHIPSRKLYESRIRNLEKKIIRLESQNSSYSNALPEETFVSEAVVQDFSNSARIKLRNQWNK